MRYRSFDGSKQCSELPAKPIVQRHSTNAANNESTELQRIKFQRMAERAMNAWNAFCLAWLAALVIPNAMSQVTKPDAIQTVVKIVASVAESRASKVEDVTAQKISELDVESASRLAEIAWAFYAPGDASSVDYDERWHELFWRAVERIRRIPPQSGNSLDVLRSLKSRLLLDGGESLKMGEIIAELETRPR